jgi:hypothetical protein
MGDVDWFADMTDLEAIRESDDPMVRVLYSMGMRQFALHERLVRLDDKVDRLIEALARSGSRPDLRAVKP